MTRRTALGVVGAMVGYLYGRPTPVQGQGQYMRLVLDGVDGIVLMYRGQQVVINPQDVIEALGAESNQLRYRK